MSFLLVPLALVFVLFFSAITACVFSYKNKIPVKIFTRAQHEFSQGHYNTTIILLKKALADDENNPSMQAMLARCYHFLGLKSHAYRILEEMMAMRRIPPPPERESFYRFLAHCLEENNHVDKAIKCYRLLLEERDDGADDHFRLGRLLLAQGHTQEAEQHLKNAIRHNPNLAGAYEALGTLFLRLKDHRQASEYLQKAFELNPQEKTAIKIGEALLMTGDFTAASQYFSTAAGEPSLSASAKIGAATCYRKLQQHAQAIDQYTELLNLPPGSATLLQRFEATYWLACCYEKIEQLNRAFKAWRKLHGKDSQYRDVKQRLEKCAQLIKERRLRRCTEVSEREFHQHAKMMLNSVGVKMFAVKSELKGTLAFGEGARGRKAVALFYRQKGELKLSDVRRYYERSRLQRVLDIYLFIFYPADAETTIEDFCREKGISFYQGEQLDRLIANACESEWERLS